MKVVLVLIIGLMAACSQAKIYDLNKQQFIEKDQFLEKTHANQTIVFGEYHYHPAIQSIQADIVQAVVIYHQTKDFSLAWEFFEYENNLNTLQAFDQFKLGEIDQLDFLKASFPTSKKPERNLPYMKSIKTTAQLGGKIITTNATRAVKKKLMDNGRESLASIDQPTLYPSATDGYFKRFKEVMGGHVGDNELRKYFAAQHYTDAIIASKVSESRSSLSFLIIGAFHSDYNDGVVRILKQYEDDVISIKVIDITKTSPEELAELKQRHSEYGYIADYLIF